MKANETQKKVIDGITSLMGYWKSTNDITSPSHMTLIEEECNLLADELDIEYDDERLTEIEGKLADIWSIIKKF